MIDISKYSIMCKLSHLQIIRTYYKENNATLGHHQHFEFGKNQNLIRLDISQEEGITTSDKAWRIRALGPPVVCLAAIRTAYT
jgi:hypothetical protein